MRRAVRILLLLALTYPMSQALAQQGWQGRATPEPAAPRAALPSTAPKVKPVAKAPSPAPAAGSQSLQAQTQYLVRSTMLTLSDANKTGNYTVLRDLAAPSFRERNSAADLAQVFAELRRTRLDLSMAAVLAPVIEETPTIDAERRLRLKGSYPTEPNRVLFDLLFEQVSGHWQLYGVSIGTRPSQTAARH